MNEVLKYNISHYEVEDFDNFLVLKAFIVSVGNNRKKTYIGKDSIENAIPTLYNRPVYCKWVDNLEDFEGHAKDNKQILNNGYVFIGHIPHNGDIGFETYDGKEFLTATTLIYKDYFPDICTRIVEEHPELSMEISVEEAFENDEGLLEISQFRFMSYVLLGRYVDPGVENAHVEVLQFSDDSKIIDEYNLKYSETLPKYKMPPDIIETLKDNINKKEANIDLDFTKELLRKEQLTFNEIVSFLDKVVNAQSDSETNFLGGEETIRWCKEIIALSEGGKEALKDNKEQEVKVEDVNGEADEKQEDFAVNNTVALLSQVVGEYDGYFQYEDCDVEKNIVYYFNYAEWKYYAASFEMEEDSIPKINFEDSERVYFGGIKWIHAKEDTDVENLRDFSAAVKYAADVVENSVQTAKELKELKEDYAELEERYDDLVKEKDELAKFKADIEKEEADNKLLEEAKDVYANYEEYLEEEVVAKFNESLLKHRDIDKLQGDVAKTVLPIIMAEANSNKENKKDEVKFNLSDKIEQEKVSEDEKDEDFKATLNKIYK